MERLGKYEIEQVLGEGAAGRVFRARDTELGRPIALKVLKDAGDDRLRARFHREAQAAARLNHPNVVTVYDTGDHDGVLYIAMELVEGESLDHIIARHATDLPRLLALIERAARAVQHAHSHGIVHRDLKPGNILVTAAGEPKVGDFGLAHVSDAPASLTRTGAVMGTPAYMAPEQVMGRVREIGPATDVYALGVVLYEVLTGRLPHDAPTMADLYQRIIAEDPTPPRRINPRIDPALEAVTLKAMSKEPERRYATAADLADDLRRHLAGEPVRARRSTWLDRVRRRVTRRAVLAAIVLGAVAAGAIGLQTLRTGRRADAMLALAARYEREGRLDQARDAYSAVLGMDAANATATDGVGRVAARRAEAARLIEEGRPALDLYLRGMPYEELVRRVQSGQSRIENARAITPHDPLVHHLLGRAWHIRGYDAQAEACWRAAVAEDAQFGPARYELGRLFMSRAQLATFGQPETLSQRLRLIETHVRAAQSEFEAAARGRGGNRIDVELAQLMLAYARGDLDTVRRSGPDCIARFATDEGVEYAMVLVGLSAPTTAEQIAGITQAIERRPRFPVALFMRATVHFRAAEYATCDADCTTAIAMAPRFGEAYYCRGTVRMKLERLDDALQDLDRAIEIDPDVPFARLSRGTVRFLRDDLDAAIADYTRAIELEPSLWSAYLNRATAHYTARRHAQAIPDLDKVLALRGEDAQALYWRGACRKELGELGAARGDFDRALKKDPKFATAYVDRAIVLKLQGDLRGAVADCTRAIEANPSYVLGHYNRATFLQDLGDHEGAIRDCDSVLKLDPSYANAYQGRANSRYAKGEFDGALADYTEMIRLRPKDAEAYFGRALTWIQKLQGNEALADYARAIDADPRHVQAWIGRAALRGALGDRDGALKDLAEALRIDPSSALAHFHRAKVHRDRQDVPAAIADFEKALALAPRDWSMRAETEEALKKLKAPK